MGRPAGWLMASGMEKSSLQDWSCRRDAGELIVRGRFGGIGGFRIPSWSQVMPNADKDRSGGGAVP